MTSDKDDGFPCGPCTVAIVLGELEAVCTSVGNDPSACKRKFEDALAGRMSIKDFVAEMEREAESVEDKASIEAVKTVLKEIHVL